MTMLNMSSFCLNFALDNLVWLTGLQFPIHFRDKTLAHHRLSDVGKTYEFNLVFFSYVRSFGMIHKFSKRDKP